MLERRTGIPITLAIIYIEVGQALGFDLRGIGFPGHFLVGQFVNHQAAGQRLSEVALIDPFTGELTDRSRCLENFERASSSAGGRGVSREDWPAEQIDAWFAPATSQQVALRLLENLKQIYLQTQANGQALAALDLQLLVEPQSFELLQQQKFLSAQIFGRKDQPPVR